MKGSRIVADCEELGAHWVVSYSCVYVTSRQELSLAGVKVWAHCSVSILQLSFLFNFIHMAFPFFGDDKSVIATMLATLPQVGHLEWIGRRPARREPLESVTEAEVQTDARLVGDRASIKRGGKRQITLIQHEHLAAVAGFLGLPEPVDPGRLRRNLVVSGLNLLALKGKQIRIGEDVLLDITGECHPCSRMEEELGPGGYNAMRGHGGLTAHIAQGGIIRVGDTVRVEEPASNQADS
jgi:MOSC domain-containing protein YiiM